MRVPLNIAAAKETNPHRNRPKTLVMSVPGNAIFSYQETSHSQPPLQFSHNIQQRKLFRQGSILSYRRR